MYDYSHVRSFMDSHKSVYSLVQARYEAQQARLFRYRLSVVLYWIVLMAGLIGGGITVLHPLTHPMLGWAKALGYLWLGVSLMAYAPWFAKLVLKQPPLKGYVR